VRCMGRGGKYVAGDIDVRMQDKLPPDATVLVEQFHLWLPHDNRLTWLLAELFNAQGNVEEAATMLVNVRWQGVGGELHEHRTVLRDAAEKLAATKKPDEFEPQPATNTTPSSKDAPADSGPVSWVPDWPPLAVGLVAGFVSGMLVLLQLQQLFRRKRPAPSAAAKSH